MRALMVALMLLCGQSAAWGQKEVEEDNHFSPVCESQQQMERFVELHDDDVIRTLYMLNRESGGQKGFCVLAKLKFSRQATVGRIKRNGKTYDIVSVEVYSGTMFPGLGFTAMPGTIWYAFYTIRGLDI